MKVRKTPLRILIVDDHPMVREGLTLRISTQPDLQVCGEAASEGEALSLVKQFTPDLVLIDISLKGGNGIDLIKQIKSLYPNVKMLVVSGFQESLYAERAFRAGALGYLNKQESHDRVLDAIRTVLAGQRFLSPDAPRRLMDLPLNGAQEVRSPAELLTDRELEVFRMIGQGKTTGVIANELYISTHTIDTHRDNIKRKLDLKSAGELTRAAVQWVLEHG